MGLDLVHNGTVLGGRYEIQRLLRSSASIRVWEASDPVLDRAVVVETLDPRCTHEARDAFVAAALASAKCTNHGVISVYDTGNENGTAFVVTELVRGDALDARLITEGPFPFEAAGTVACEAADALGAAHASGLIHGGLRSSGIVLTPGNRVKIGGFGAPPTEDRYCAPEIAAGGEATEVGDVYALAVCIVEMLAGQPFDPRNERVGDALAARDDVPTNVRGTLERALDPDPGARAAHVRAVGRAFSTALHHAPVATRTAAPLHAQPTEAVAAVEVPTTAVTMPVLPDAPPSAPIAPASAPPRARSIALIATLLIALGVLIGVGAVVLLVFSPGPGSQRSEQGNVGGPVPIVGVFDFDPAGDNGQENRRLAPLAHDGNLATVWSTETYASPTFGNSKPGVGLRLDLAGPERVGRVVVHTTEPGWSATTYASDDTPATLAGWGAPLARIEDAPVDATITLDPQAKKAHVLVWFTRLPASGRLDVREIDLLGG